MRAPVREPLGGLVTRKSPILLERTESPDLLNVLMGDGSVDLRGGFIPLFKDRMKMNAVRNTGFHATSRVTNSAGSADGDFLIVPGCLTAPHRPIYESVTNIAFDLFFEVGDLTTTHGGNGINGGGIGHDGSPYTIKVRPIFSKGPVKRSDDTSGTGLGAASIAWVTTNTAIWGNHTDSGMPFCLYLFNNSGTWEFRLSAHALLVAGPAWSLQTATSTVPVVEGARYHIVGHVTNTRVYIRVARLIEPQWPVYTGNETTFVATAVGWNKCPFQVFDCPQQFIDSTTSGSSTQRPGLGLNATSDLGGYMFACKRAEGVIEDIAVWVGQAFASNDELDRRTKLDLSQVAPTNYWNMLLPGTDYVQDATGRGNHLYFVPRGPITDRHSGGKDGSSWWFNAQTSYALVDVGSEVEGTRDNPNWNYFDEGAVGAAMRGLVTLNLAHGMQVEFWVDSIEPQFQQVIAEIHGALRLAINADGLLVGYCRSGGGAGGSAQEHGQLYQGPVTGTATLVPGKRYTATLMRRTGGTALDLYVDGQLDASTTGLDAVTTAESRPVSGVTLGMGSWQVMTRGATLSAAEIAGANQINTDSRSGFCGRIESFAIVSTSNGGTLAPTYKTQGREDWDFSETRTMINPVAVSRNTLRPADLGDTVRAATGGGVASVAGQEEAGQALRYVVYDSGTSPQLYELQNDTMDGAETGAGRYGHDTLTGLGVKIAHCLAYYRLKADDRDVEYGGAYTRGLEYRYDGSTVTTPNQARNDNKAVHVQFSAETDLTGTLGIVQRRCVESDAISETANSIYSQPQYFTHRQRPYPFRSPLEVGPRWAAGMVKPLPGQAHVTLVTDWEVQEGGRSFKITACGRQLYWAKPLWEPDSPFAEANPQSVFLAGAAGSHLFVKATAATMSFDYATRGVSFEGWVKPFRLDGRRLLFAKMTPEASTSQINWMVYTQDGSLVILGTEGSGTRAWTFAEGTIPASGTFHRASKSLRVGSWNHIRIVMGFSGGSPGVTVHVNGAAVAMANLNGLTGGLQTDAQGAAATDQPSGQLYLGGLPNGVVPSYDTAAATSVSLPMLPWYGLLSEFRFAPGATTVAGFVPRVRFTASANTTLLHLNEGTGWRLVNSGTAATDHGHSQVAEYIVIAEGLEESTGHRYDALTYRDRLLVSNGESRVQSIRFGAFTDQTPFVVSQHGILPPVRVDTGTSAPLTGSSGPITDGVYEVWLSFFDDLGNESEPTRLGRNTITGSPYATMRMLIERLPRSHDPQVVGRRLYASAVGGGLPIFNRDLFENDSFSHEVFIYNSGGLGAVVGEKLVAPRGRHLAVANASLVVADLPDEPAGQNAFAFARGDNPAYFTTASTAVIDSQDGKPLQGIREILGQVFLSKRDSVYRLSVGALVTAVNVEGEIRRAHNSDGVGAGGASANNLIYGAGDRGVFAFNGGPPAYLSEQIEPTWREEIDQTDAGLSRMFGAFLRPASQYWLSVRLRNTTVNNTILVLELVGAPAWSRLLVPDHSYLGAVADPATQAPAIAIGTTSGAVLRYQETVYADWSDDAANAFGAITLDGSDETGFPGSGVGLGMSGGNFDTVLGGMAGAVAAITFINGSGATVTEYRPIRFNTDTAFYWTEPLTDAVLLISFTIGGIDGYWTSPWITERQPNGEQKMKRIGLEMVPRSGTLTLRVAAIRQTDQPVKAFPSVASKYEEWSVDMTTGWLDDMRMPKNETRGHYHRLRVGTSGIRKPFGLVSYTLDLEPLDAQSHAGRRS